MSDDLLRFRSAIARRLGVELTPEVAAAIEAEALGSAGEPVDLSRLQSITRDGYVIAVERFSDILGELHPLHVAHWQETEKHRHGLPLAPDYEAMRRHEQSGRLVQFTVRRGGLLVGNLRVYIGVSAHSGTPFAVFPVRERAPSSEEDTLYLAPAHRGGFLAIHLMRYAERVLIGLGMREIRADSKLINRADVLMRRLGYTPVATKFVKIIKEQDHVC